LVDQNILTFKLSVKQQDLNYIILLFKTSLFDCRGIKNLLSAYLE
jgi:hypothetical protein